MSTADAQRAAKRDWMIESEIDDDLARVRSGDLTGWFVRDAPPGEAVDSIRVSTEAQLWADVGEVTVNGQSGLLIPRYEGGLLVDALRTRGGMGAALALGVLDEVLEVLENAPSAPDGYSRIALRGLAVDGRGDIAVLPGRMRNAAARTDSAELGELLHLALTGRTWEETGLPLAMSAPEVPVPIATLVTDLLEGSDTTVDGHALRARILPLGPSRGRGFLPAEPGVADDAAPTGTIGADLVRALRGGPPIESGRAGGERAASRQANLNNSRARSSRRSAAAVGERRTSIGTERRARNRRVRHPKRRRFSPAILGVLGLCVAAAFAGIAIMLTGAIDDGHHTPPRASTTPSQTGPPVGEAKGDMPATSTAGPATSAPTLPVTPEALGESDPLAAVKELSRLRVKAFSQGDTELLARLTVPGSPAAQADTGLDLQGCEECATDLELSKVESASPAEASASEPIEGQQTYVRAAMRTEGATPEDVLFVLQWHAGEWRVHSVQRA